MSRTLASSVATSIATQAIAICHLIEFQFAGGTVSYTDAPVDVRATATGATASTWVAIGGVLTFAAVEESADPRASGVHLTMSGVEQTFLTTLLTDTYLYRTVLLWRAHWDEAAGTLASTPQKLGEFRMTDRWTVTEDRQSNTVTIDTRLRDAKVDLDRVRGIQMNVDSHNTVVGITGDKGFEFVPKLGERLILWGPAPFRWPSRPRQR